MILESLRRADRSFLTARFLGRESRWEDESEFMSSSSVSEEVFPTIMGKTNVGNFGMETGCDGLEDRLVRWGKVGEMGEDCGVLRRTKVEIGVLPNKSASTKANFSGRLEWVVVRPSAEERRPTVRCGNGGHGDDDNAYGRGAE